MTDTVSRQRADTGGADDGSHRRRGREAGHARTAWLFLAPFGLLFLTMYAAPMLFALWQSLFVERRSGLGLGPATSTFDPLGNYVRAFSEGDFVGSLLRVLAFGVVQVPFMLLLALFLALLIDAKSARLKSFFRLAAFMPYAVPGVVAAIMWAFLYTPLSSPILQGIQEATGWQVPIFADTTTSLAAVANVVTWSWAGYNMIIIYSALQTIPEELIEAAELDGAGPWKIALRIKVPMVRPALIMTCLFSIIGSAQLYNEPRVLQRVSQGAIGSEFTPIMAAQSSLAAGNYPLAAAQSVALALLVGVLSFVFLRISQRGDRS
ncbi:sugar ABC transporter permease [Pseudoclavibacter chungangensis]|uniref:Sugar ABC transporter permease n=1 Tax=Pseudoclavibacter chungangensis TaxID=587635 RepID=A0A7J5BP61_9MICO|nr:sugar ABC transporter permease [Pseudoclavibacter chungangensis]KAB1653817.1 sugar ABC transporter permease [Pseudoclavibacter chungangensis]NYJ68174.1 multiple sugar transport system permease protein [Pseudoclavibacter chungangensis]